ncbi:MAG: long-chain fatty acid--CoA ligase [Thermodesulfobacteriota bacterium]|nr:long-chain fatty acid--CoA ligase [Thermodesulfobacteriota bacterium]
MTINIGSTIPRIFQSGVERYQYETFIRYMADGGYTNISWIEAQRKVVSLGLGLLSMGVRKGDMIALFSENRWEWIIADIAVLSIGAIDVPIYSTSSGEEAAYIINDSGSKIVIVSDKEHLDRILSVKSKIKGIGKIITFEAVETDDKNILNLEQVIAMGDKAKDRSTFYEQLDTTHPEDLATLIYTSGTTGHPKGVMLTHDNFVSNVKQCYATHPMINHYDQTLLFLPLSHSFGRTVGLYLMIYIGAIISLAEDFSTVLQNLQEIRPTLIISVPRLFEKAYSGVFSQIEASSPLRQKLFSWATNMADRAVDYRVHNKEMPFTLRVQYDVANMLVFSRIRAALGLDKAKIFVNGGGPLAIKIDRFFNSIGINVHNGYGLTETTPVTNTNTFEVFEFGSAGLPLPDTRIMIAEDGEIFVKGPQVMKGYYNQPEATKAAFTEDDWLKTGDIGFIDEKGCLHITDRKRDLIITGGGKNIAPQNIENTLMTDRFIEQAVVIGEGRRFLSALVVPNFAELASYAKQQGISFDSNENLIRKPEIEHFYDEEIRSIMKVFARVEQIRRFTLLPSEFIQETGELTPTLKIRRKIIGEKYASVIEEMYKE